MNEALKIANALKPMIRSWYDEWNGSCVRRKKVEVTQAPHTNDAGASVITVQEAFGTPFDVPYSSLLSNATVGQSVFVEYSYNASNMIAVPIIQTGGGGGGDFLPLSGGTLTGSLFLPSAAPTANNQATTKSYIDSLISSASPVVTTNEQGWVMTIGEFMVQHVTLGETSGSWASWGGVYYKDMAAQDWIQPFSQIFTAFGAVSQTIGTNYAWAGAVDSPTTSSTGTCRVFKGSASAYACYPGVYGFGLA